jgi:hypothetical protein
MGVSLFPRCAMTLLVSPRILYVGDRVKDAAGLPSERDHMFRSTVVARTADVESVLAKEAPFELVIIDHCLQQLGGVVFLERLHRHSPEAERLIIAPAPEPAEPTFAAGDAEVVRALHTPHVRADVSPVSRPRARSLGEAQRHADGW